MAKVNGTVAKIISRDVETRYGTKKGWSVQVDGEWYSVGFKRPEVAESDFVEITYDMKGSYRNASSIVKATPSGIAPTALKSPAPVGGGGGRVFPIPPLSPERAIVRQSSLKAAVETLGYISVDGTDEESMVELTIRIARKYEAYACGDLDLADAKAMMAKEDD